MRTSTFLSIAAALSTSVSATVHQGFNYGSTFTGGAAKAQADFEAEFKAAQNLVGTSGAFTSARLYTMIQGLTTADPISAIPAAIKTKTSLLLGIWASGGQAGVTNEISALTAAITNYGTDFTDLVVGLSVGSEDLYRISTTGIANDPTGVGADPATLVKYITQVKTALKGTALEDVLIGHVDTWNSWTNSTNNPVIAAIDWLGVDEYPYFQSTVSNGIESAYDLFWEAYNATAGAGGGKPVWITETGWPVSGKTENLGVPSLANAKTFYDEIGCASAFGKVNTWWYVLQDAAPTTPVPSFGVLGSSTSDATLGTKPLYDLSCANVTLPASLLSSAATTGGSTATKTGSSSGSQTSAGGSGGSGGSSGGSGTTTGTSPSSTTKSNGASTFAVSGLFLISAMFVALF
ncbi:glycoside hydrolase family 17 protein [Stipitochalara longipes BDJ]|nr:glycoside hydrolase family 17 protein [Stipitochalara longipes BDJ]